MKYDTLKALVNSKVYENTEQEITGEGLNEVLQSAIASLGAHYQMGGLVSPTDHITVGDEPVVFIATTPGTYTYFGGLVVADGEVALLVWSGTAWSKQTPDIATRTEVNQLDQFLPTVIMSKVDSPSYNVGSMSTSGIVNTSATSYGYTAPIELKPGETIHLNQGSGIYHGDNVALLYLCNSQGTFISTLISGASITKEEEYKNSSDSIIYVGISGYTTQLKYYIDVYTKCASEFSVELVINLIKTGYLYIGIADLTTNPGTPTTKVFYIASVVGIYTNFGGLVVNDGEVVALKYNGTTWVKEVTGIASAAKLTEVEHDVTDLLPLCTKTTGKYVNASSVTPNSSNFDYYTYKINGEDKLYVYTKMQYSNNLPAYILYSTDAINANGYISHTNWKSGDGVYEIDIPENCKLIAINVYRPNLAAPYIGGDDAVFWKIYSTLSGELSEVVSGLASVEERVAFLENLSIDGIAVGTKVPNTFIKINGDTSGTSSGSYIYKIPNNGYKNIYARGCYDLATVAALAFYNGEPSAANLISAIPASANIVKYAEVPEGTTMIAIQITASYSSYEKIMLIPDLSEMFSEVQNLKSDVAEIQEQIENINNNGVLAGDGSAAEVKEIINTTRPYYFGQGWGNDDGFGYLDERLKLVPEGKHFLVYTDIHLDYYGNFGLSQKQSIVMKYVQKRLRDCNVVFLGDFIGTQPTELAAQKEMAWFAADNYSKFGDRFFPVLGDHDTDRVGGGLPQGSQLTEEYIYETYFKQAHIYGAVQDKAIPVIDTIVFSDDAGINATKRAAWKNYMKMHYYKDDEVNKIRFISLQATGAYFRSMPNGFNTPRIQLPFICNAILTAPNDYDIVIVAHEYQLVSEGASTATVWEREMFKALTAFRNRTSYTIATPYSGESDDILVWPYVKGEYPSTFDYSNKTGKVAVLQGDTHYDSVCYYDAAENESNPVGYGYTPDAGDVIRIIIDRATLVDDNGFPTSTYSDPLKVLRCYRRAVAQSGDVVLLGTTNEVLFDVVTINEDGITLTRFGDQPVAGKVGLFPIFSEEESYEVGDKVVYYETIGSAYFPKAYTYISAHTPGAFNANEVEEYIVTEPYVRNYIL